MTVLESIHIILDLRKYIFLKYYVIWDINAKGKRIQVIFSVSSSLSTRTLIWTNKIMHLSFYTLDDCSQVYVILSGMKRHLLT